MNGECGHLRGVYRLLPTTAVIAWNVTVQAAPSLRVLNTVDVVREFSRMVGIYLLLAPVKT